MGGQYRVSEVLALRVEYMTAIFLDFFEITHQNDCDPFMILIEISKQYNEPVSEPTKL